MRLESEPKAEHHEVWAYLTPDEAREVLAALVMWAEDDPPMADTHFHITDDAGRELTIAIVTDPDAAFAERDARGAT
jgi:hypothetical protein